MLVCQARPILSSPWYLSLLPSQPICPPCSEAPWYCHNSLCEPSTLSSSQAYCWETDLLQMYTKSIKQSQEVIPSSPNNWRNSIFITCSFAWFKWISQLTVYLIYLWNHSPLCLCFDPQMGWKMGKNSDFNQITGGPFLSISWSAWWLSKSFNLPKNSFHFPFFLFYQTLRFPRRKPLRRLVLLLSGFHKVFPCSWSYLLAQCSLQKPEEHPLQSKFDRSAQPMLLWFTSSEESSRLQDMWSSYHQLCSLTFDA